MKRPFVNFLLSFLLLIITNDGYSNCISKYDINVKYIDDYTINVECLITIDSVHPNELILNFGGLINNLFLRTISDLKIFTRYDEKTKKAKYRYYKKEKKLKIKLNNKIETKQQFIITYNFYNLWSKITLKSKSTIFNQSKNSYWYPILDGENIYNLKVHCPGNFMVTSNSENNNLISGLNYNEYFFSSPNKLQDLNFLWFDTTLYIENSFAIGNKKITIYYQNNKDSTGRKMFENRITQSFRFFSNHLFDYKYNELTIIDADYIGSTNLGSYILINNCDMRNFTAIHELSHSWCGDAVAFIKNSKGYFLMEESLNEYLTLLFMRSIEGNVKFENTLTNYNRIYCSKIDSTEEKYSLYNVSKYTGSTHYLIQKKGPVVINNLLLNSKFNNPEILIFNFFIDNYGKRTEYYDFIKYLEINGVSESAIHKFDSEVKSIGCVN